MERDFDFERRRLGNPGQSQQNTNKGVSAQWASSDLDSSPSSGSGGPPWLTYSLESFPVSPMEAHQGLWAQATPSAIADNFSVVRGCLSAQAEVPPSACHQVGDSRWHPSCQSGLEMLPIRKTLRQRDC